MYITTSKPVSANNIAFGRIIIPDGKVRSKILNELSEIEMSALKQDLLQQQNNPVDAIIQKGKCGLKAKLVCQYRLKNFKENYKQIPLLESSKEFLKRIIKTCNEYKKQLNL